MVEPFTIAANVTGQVNPTEQDIALIYGAGPMGLVTLQALKGVYKVKQVIVADRIDERLAMAERSGADWVINNSEQTLQSALEERASNRQLSSMPPVIRRFCRRRLPWPLRRRALPDGLLQ
jgi:L-gulonate 5-dehydrogenase